MWVDCKKIRINNEIQCSCGLTWNHKEPDPHTPELIEQARHAYGEKIIKDCYRMLTVS